MELKQSSISPHLIAAFTFNCTLMELKRISGAVTPVDCAAFNCTLMELKHWEYNPPVPGRDF